MLSLIDPDVVDHERLVPGVEPLLTRLPELPSLGLENQDKINTIENRFVFTLELSPQGAGGSHLW